MDKFVKEGVENIIKTTRVLQVLMWIAIISYSIGCSFLFPDVKRYSMILFYIAGFISFYLWHWQAHHKLWFNKECYKYHHRHHYIHYPPDAYYGTKEAEEYWNLDSNGLYKSSNPFAKIKNLLPGFTGFYHELLLYTFALAIFAFAYFYIGVSANTIFCALVGYLIMAFISIYLHQAFHVKGHWLNRYNWFRVLNTLHYKHHKVTTSNYAIVNFHLDNLFGTYFLYDLDALIVIRNDSKLTRGISIAFRTLIVTIICVGWYASQELISNNAIVYDSGQILDLLHEFTTPAFHFFEANELLSTYILILSSLHIDIAILVIVFYFIMALDSKPFLAMTMTLVLRQLCQLSFYLPVPSEMIWFDPGFPSLFITYETTNDLFFSGHSAVIVISTMHMLHESDVFPLKMLKVLPLAFQLVTLLVFRLHWTCDILMAIAVAIVSYWTMEKLEAKFTTKYTENKFKTL